MAGSLRWPRSGKGEDNALLGCTTSWPYRIIAVGRGAGVMGTRSGAAPLAWSQSVPVPPGKGSCGCCQPSTGVPCQSPAWDPRSFQACPWLLQLGSYLLLDAFLPADGEERSGRAAFCSLKVICRLQQERRLSARKAGVRGCRSGGPHRRCEEPAALWLGWGTGAVAGVQDSNANYCSSSLLEEQSALLCFGLFFFFLFFPPL